MKKIFLSIILVLLLAGCWDRNELTEIGIVAAMAIDKDPDTGEYEVTSQFLRPAAESTQTPSPERPYLLVSHTGKTIFEAKRNSNQTTDRHGFFAHNKVVIINEELAREGLLPIIDSFKRGKEIRGHVWLCIAKGVDAKEILGVKSDNIARIPAMYLQSMINNAEQGAATINILNYFKQTLGEGIDPVAGVLTIESIDTEPYERVKLTGGAVFKKDQLKGFLNENEIRGYNWIKGEGPANTGAISLPSLLEEGKFVTVEVRDVSAQIKPKVDGNDQISFTIDVYQEGRITAQQATVGPFEDRKQHVDYLKLIEEENQKLIEDEIHLVVEKAQKEFQSDIFGFGRALEKEYPKVWQNVKDNWSETFAHVPYTINADVEIPSSMLLQSPFEPAQ
ncbi:Ger(x)C family spore germination protein [Halalkalibacter alkalisediminis]|uniref:Ger(X)C family spore germination protein n=1 Tax=Halalkalibacter alkalisediminis TaxID=935616 RepID=A0ABV6NG94_9BACI|nr:Ger(x)C family spore germination protein [Halalkalibacter alkalisediminis]